MTAPPVAERRPAGRPPKIRNRARWGLYVNADHRRRGEERALRKGHGDYTDVLRTLMAAYAAGKLDTIVAAPAED
jgi:hypothetical protein